MAASLTKRRATFPRKALRGLVSTAGWRVQEEARELPGHTLVTWGEGRWPPQLPRLSWAGMQAFSLTLAQEASVMAAPQPKGADRGRRAASGSAAGEGLRWLWTRALVHLQPTNPLSRCFFRMLGWVDVKQPAQRGREGASLEGFGVDPPRLGLGFAV